MEKETIIDHIIKFKLNDYDELLDIVESNEISSEVKVILVAEKFDPEVIVTSDWLSSYSLSIHAYSIGVHQHSTETFLTVDQRYPLKGLSDVYDSRTVSRDRKTVMKDVNWEDILKNCITTLLHEH